VQNKESCECWLNVQSIVKKYEKFLLFSTANPLFFRISATVTTVAMAGKRTVYLVSFA
jgi:hypothetical protein